MPRSIALHSSLASMRSERLSKAAVLIVSGRFDRAAIMREAVKVARTILPSLGPWARRMAVALRTVWARAKSAITAAAAAEPFPIREPHSQRLGMTRRHAFRPRAYLLGSRATSHGW